MRGRIAIRRATTITLLAVALVAAAAVAAPAEITNQITAITPASAAAGTTDLLVTFTLDTDAPLAPPAGDGPQSVLVGALSGGSITHSSQYVETAHLTIPADAPAGARDVSISFAIPGGTLVFVLVGGFSVTAPGPEYTISQSISDEAQRNTIAANAAPRFVPKPPCPRGRAAPDRSRARRRGPHRRPASVALLRPR